MVSDCTARTRTSSPQAPVPGRFVPRRCERARRAGARGATLRALPHADARPRREEIPVPTRSLRAAERFSIDVPAARAFSLARRAVAGVAVLAALGLVAVATAAAPPKSAAQLETLSASELRQAAELRDAAVQGTDAYELVRSLTVHVGPRPAGSAGDKAAVAWALAMLRQLGFANVRAERVLVPHWDRGEADGWIEGPARRPVALLALGGSVGTPEGGVDAAVVRATSLQALDAMDAAAVAGKIVFLDVAMERTKDITGYANAVPARGAGWASASRKGAVALLLRSIGTDHNRLAHTGAMRPDEKARHIPAAALSNPDADVLAALLAEGEVRFHLRLTARELPPEESANVIGEVVGSEKPEEIVLLGAHLDSWDPGTGAIDDGAGVAVVTETARRLAALPKHPRRTVRVVLFANEEFGLSGAHEYAEAHAAEIARHVAMAESDLGADPVLRVGGRVLEGAQPTLATLASLLKPLGVERNPQEGDGGADLSTLTGVPVVSLDQDARAYFDFHHTANDTLDKVDRKHLDQVVAAFVTFAYVAAQSPPGFRPTP
jgi:hypothetical protein